MGNKQKDWRRGIRGTFGLIDKMPPPWYRKRPELEDKRNDQARLRAKYGVPMGRKRNSKGM